MPTLGWKPKSPEGRVARGEGVGQGQVDERVEAQPCRLGRLLRGDVGDRGSALRAALRASPSLKSAAAVVCVVPHGCLT